MSRVYILSAESWEVMDRRSIPEEEHFTPRKVPLKELKELAIGLYSERFNTSVVVMQDPVDFEKLKEDRDALIGGVVENGLIKRIGRVLKDRMLSQRYLFGGNEIYAFANSYHMDTLRRFNETLGFPRTYVKVVRELGSGKEETTYGVLDLVKLKQEFEEFIERGKKWAVEELISTVTDYNAIEVYAFEARVPSMEVSGKYVRILEPFTPASLGFSLKHGWGTMIYL